MHLRKMPCCIILRNLWIESYLKIMNKMLNSTLYLNSNTTCSIDYRPKEDIEHYIETLCIKYACKITPKTPTSKSEHFLKQGPINLVMIVRFLKMSTTIM